MSQTLDVAELFVQPTSASIEVNGRTVEFAFNRLAYTGRLLLDLAEARTRARKAEATGDTGEGEYILWLARALAQLLVSWPLTKGGEPLAITEVNLLEHVPLPVQEQLLAAINEASLPNLSETETPEASTS